MIKYHYYIKYTTISQVFIYYILYYGYYILRVWTGYVISRDQDEEISRWIEEDLKTKDRLRDLKCKTTKLLIHQVSKIYSWSRFDCFQQSTRVTTKYGKGYTCRDRQAKSHCIQHKDCLTPRNYPTGKASTQRPWIDKRKTSRTENRYQ